MKQYNQHYWEFYGLKADPFITDLDSYHPSHWEQHFDLLNHLCHTVNVLLAVIGMDGIGKSTFLRLFYQQQNDSAQICQLIASANMDVMQLLAAMSSTFSLPTITNERLEDQLDFYLAKLQHHSKLCLLLIDDAQKLPDETLKLLLYLVQHQSDSQMRLHIVLTGTPALQDKLSRLAAQEENGAELTYYLTLTPFTFEETSAYLHNRLSQVGLPAALPFNTAELVRIHRLSGGSPKLINQCATQTLLKQAIHSVSFSSPFKNAIDFIKTYNTRFLGGAILLCGLLLVVPLMSKVNSKSEANHVENLSRTDLDVRSMPEKGKVDVINQETKVLVNEKKEQTVIEPKPLDLLAPSDQTKFFSKEPHQNKNLKNPVPTVIQIQETKKNDTQQVKQKAKIVKQQIIKVVNTTHLLPMKDSKEAVSLVSQRELLKKTQQVKLQNPQNYTLQLIGLSSEKAMRDFIARNKLSKQAKYFHSTLNGKDWFVLLYGEYKTPQSAKVALQQLPAEVQEQHPWVRKVANVQLSLRKAGSKLN